MPVDGRGPILDSVGATGITVSDSLAAQERKARMYGLIGNQNSYVLCSFQAVDISQRRQNHWRINAVTCF